MAFRVMLGVIYAAAIVTSVYGQQVLVEPCLKRGQLTKVVCQQNRSFIGELSIAPKLAVNGSVLTGLGLGKQENCTAEHRALCADCECFTWEVLPDLILGTASCGGDLEREQGPPVRIVLGSRKGSKPCSDNDQPGMMDDNWSYLWFLIILFFLIAIICIVSIIYLHCKRKPDKDQGGDDPSPLSIVQLEAAEQGAPQNETAPGPAQEGGVEEFYDAEQELRVDGVLQGHNASQESDSGRLFPEDLCISRDKNGLSSFLSLFRDSSESTLKEGKGAQAITQEKGVKQTEEFFDCEEVHTLGTGVVEDDVSENVCQGDTCSPLDRCCRECFESEMEVSHAVECSELVTTTAAKQIFYSQKVVLVVSEIRLPDYGKQAELVVMPATPFMDANTTKVIPVFEDVIPEYTSAATPPPSVMVSPASKTIAGEVGHPIGRDSASSLDASAQTETNLLPYKPGGKGPSGPPSLDVTAKESRHMERPNIDDDSDSDSGDDDEPGGAGCTGGEVPTAGEPVLLGVNATNVKLGLTGENSNVRPSNSNGSGCLLWTSTNMIRDADGDVSPSAYTKPVEEPTCRDFNGNLVLCPEEMCVRNSNRAIMELRSGSGDCPTGQLGANTGTSDSRWDINSVRINKLNEPFGLRQRETWSACFAIVFRHD